jgi:hypothetical protein
MRFRRYRRLFPLVLLWTGCHLFVPLLVAPALLGSSAAARTPKAPPTPPSCRASCQGKGRLCLEPCAVKWQRLPWRERLGQLYPKAVRCLKRTKKGCDQRCKASLRRCVWRALGLRSKRMARCWSAFDRALKRCVSRRGRGGWICRDEARVQMHVCRRRAARIRRHGDAYRLMADVELQMGHETR